MNFAQWNRKINFVQYYRNPLARRGGLLALLLILASAHWYNFFFVSKGPWPAILATLASILLIVYSKQKLLLVIKGLEILAALAAVGVSRFLVTGKPVLPGLIGLGVIVGFLFLLQLYRGQTERLPDSENEPFVEDGRSGLNLSAPPPKSQHKLD